MTIKWMSKIVTTLLLVLFTNALNAQNNSIDQVVAVVGNEIILKSDVENRFLAEKSTGRVSDGDLRCEVFEELLTEKLLMAEAELDSTIEITDKQINQSLEDRINQFVNYLGSVEAVEKEFRRPISHIRAELRLNIRTMLFTQEMNRKILKDVTITPAEVRHAYRDQDKDDLPEVPDQIEYREIVRKPEITLEEENKIKARLRNFKKQIESGERSFETIALLYSQDGTAQKGGELGFLGRGQLDKEYADAAFNLKGDKISNVVKSEFGYHLIQVIERKNELINTRHIILIPKPSAEELTKAEKLLDSVANEIRKDNIKFEDAALLYSTNKNTRVNGGLVLGNNMESKLSLTDVDGTDSKELSGMKIGEISNPFYNIDKTNGQATYKLVKLDNRIPAHKANLQDDYVLLSEFYLSKKKQEVMGEWISERQKKTYITIDPLYQTCQFKYKNWIK
ncbi:MAG: peptidylprolyl isomerase [Bacteroidales bacterium]